MDDPPIGDRWARHRPVTWRATLGLIIISWAGTACSAAAVSEADPNPSAGTEPTATLLEAPSGERSPSVPATSPTTTDGGSGTTAPTWTDEFEGDALNPSWWTFEHPFMGLDHGSVHLYSPDAVTVEDGLLRITAARLDTPVAVDLDDDGTADRSLTWSSGFITTRGLVNSGPGMVEVRLRAPAGQGLWPAVWLRPATAAYGSWPRSGELDVVEFVGNAPDQAVTTAHWWDEGHRLHAATSVLDDDGFHVYALAWGPDALEWTIDGAVVHRLSDWESAVGPRGAPFDQDFYLNINLAVGGSWPGPPDDGTPDRAVLEVDWIRVYGAH